MQIVSQCCDGCEKSLCLNSGVRSYHKINLNFHTYIIDENTGMEEEVPTMKRISYSVYCEECFEKLTKHLENFVDEVGRTITKQTNPLITGESEPISEEAKLSKKSDNFKAFKTVEEGK